MFGLGIWEILAILFVVVLLIRPQDLPKLLYKAGKMYGKLKELSNAMLEMVRNAESATDLSSLNDGVSTVGKEGSDGKPGGADGFSGPTEKKVEKSGAEYTNREN